MGYLDKSIDTIRKALDDQVITSDELFEEGVKKAHRYQDPYNSFVTILEKKEIFSDKQTILSGIPYVLKDNISTKGILTTGSSNILKDYIPIYDATIYQKLKNSGAVLLGKTVLDELALGGTGTTGHTGVVKNPWNKEHIIGGSSAGSAAAVALGIVPFALGSDTGDSVRLPAGYGGIVGFKPTYGLISRYGLFAFASSLDHVGCFARNVKDIASVVDIIKGYDEKDMRTLPDDKKVLVDHLTKNIAGKKLCYPKDACDLSLYVDQADLEIIECLTKFHETIELCQKIGFEVEAVDFGKELLMAIDPVYQTISCAEATTNNANLAGLHFGIRGTGKKAEDMIMQARTEGFSELIKRRFVLGSFILQKENQEKLFLNAGRVRRLIVERMNELFKTYDGIIMPVSAKPAPKFGEQTDKLSVQHLILGQHLAIANFGGYPSISIPNGFVNGLPISINITGRVMEDEVVLNMAHQLEAAMDYKDQIAKGGIERV